MTHFGLFTQCSHIHIDSSLHSCLPGFPLALSAGQRFLLTATCTEAPHSLTPARAEQDACPPRDGTLVNSFSALGLSQGIPLMIHWYMLDSLHEHTKQLYLHNELYSHLMFTFVCMWVYINVCMYLCCFTCTGVCACLCLYVGHRMTLSVIVRNIIHLFWHQLGQNGWQLSPKDPLASSSPALGLQISASTRCLFTWALGIELGSSSSWDKHSLPEHSPLCPSFDLEWNLRTCVRTVSMRLCTC